MPLLLPINALPGEASVNGVSFSGATLLEIEAEVIKTARATFAGATALEFFHGQGSITFTGATALAISGRLNDEANVFGGAQFDGETLLEFAPEGFSSAGVEFAGATLLEVTGVLSRTQDLVFTFFVDIQSAALSSALNNPANIRAFTGRLIVDGVPVPILRAVESGADSTLGIGLSVVLARPDISQITAESSVDFDLGIWVEGEWAWIPRLTGARMSGRGARYANREGLPADSVEITFADIMGDRWNRAPDVPTTLYDPQIVDAPTVDTISSQTVYDSEGVGIVPFYQAISGMRLSDVLEAAYVDGCGFDHVSTNIDNFPVEEVVFSQTGGYDAGARPLIAPFDPIMFAVGNDLWIVTLDNPLPAGFDAREFPASLSEGIDDALPGREPVNALLVTLKDTGTGDYFTEEVETRTERAGIFGTSGYTESDIERRVRRYRNFLTPTKVEREEEVYLRTRVLDYQFNEISTDSRTNTFDRLNRPTGYARTFYSRLPNLSDVDTALALQKSEEEAQTISYGPHPLYPERDVQKQIVTTRSGLVLTDNDNQYLGNPYKISLHNAHKSGYVDPNADQQTSFGAIETVTETLRVQGGQVFRDRRVTNHVAGIDEPPTSQIVPGDISFDRRRDTGRTRTVLLRVEGTSASGRRVQSFDVSSLPPDIGMKLAQKRLARLNSPPREANVQMPFIDPSMRRGLDLNLRGRGGVLLGTYIVRGYSLTLEPNAEGVVEGKMSFTARELK
jgi:hypothetical protein